MKYENTKVRQAVSPANALNQDIIQNPSRLTSAPGSAIVLKY
jgi:hypothetical protein